MRMRILRVGKCVFVRACVCVFGCVNAPRVIFTRHSVIRSLPCRLAAESNYDATLTTASQNAAMVKLKNRLSDNKTV